MFARSLTNTTEFKAGVLFILISCISLLVDVILYGFQLSTKEFKESVRVLKILKIFCLLIERLSRYRWLRLLVQELQPQIMCARLAQLPKISDCPTRMSRVASSDIRFQGCNFRRPILSNTTSVDRVVKQLKKSRRSIGGLESNPHIFR